VEEDLFTPTCKVYNVRIMGIRALTRKEKENKKEKDKKKKYTQVGKRRNTLKKTENGHTWIDIYNENA